VGTLCFSCHGELKQRIEKGKAHAPVSMGMCLSCHASHGSDNPGMTRRTGAAVCTGCHSIEKQGLVAKHQGFSLANANCVGCHDPHVSTTGTKGMLKAVPHRPFAQAKCADCHGTRKTGEPLAAAPEICFRCHEGQRSWLNEPVVHGPIKERRSCLSCHGAHTGNATAMLDREGQNLCFECHNRKAFQRRVVHAALENGCGTCHDAHAGKNKKLLTQDVESLCRQCHEDTSQHLHKVSGVKDPRTDEPLTCVSCHLPHSSDQDHLLTHEPTRELCIQCHDPSMRPKGE
jgi:predicted CXXCH cytochrome family protein